MAQSAAARGKAPVLVTLETRAALNIRAQRESVKQRRQVTVDEVIWDMLEKLYPKEAQDLSDLKQEAQTEANEKARRAG